LELFKKVLPAILILLAVGVLTGTWIISGIVPMFIYYGLEILSPQFFLISATILCSIISVVTGTSWGTVGTVGVALMGIAQSFQIPLPVAAGAIIVGSYFGDKLSPLSETANMAAIIVDVSVYQHLRHLLYTTVPAYIISLLFYWYISRDYTVTVNSKEIMEISHSLAAAFKFNWLLLIPPGIILGAVIFQKEAAVSMLVSSLAAAVLAVILQGAKVNEILLTIWRGYHGTTENNLVNQILSRGGIQSMLGVALLAGGLFIVLNHLLKLPWVQGIQKKMVRTFLPTGLFIFPSLFTVLAVIITTGLSYLAIFIPGELFIKEYRRRGIAPQTLSRTLEDCGTAVAPLIPWGVAGVYMANTLKVPTLEYLPYAVMCYLTVVIATFYGFTKLFIYKNNQR
jgi:Na+:H+ antiporter, NhaC family